MKPAQLPAGWWRDPVHVLAFGAGAGAVPRAPGTAGTIVAIPLYLLILGLHPVLYMLVVVGLLLAGIALCAASARRLGVHDHPAIVWDEIVGYLITMFLAPAGWVWIVAGFALFRLFDVWKPFPIRRIDRGMGGGWGIMLDDVLAGLYALLCLQLLARVVAPAFG